MASESLVKTLWMWILVQTEEKQPLKLLLYQWDYWPEEGDDDDDDDGGGDVGGYDEGDENDV